MPTTIIRSEGRAPKAVFADLGDLLGVKPRKRPARKPQAKKRPPVKAVVNPQADPAAQAAWDAFQANRKASA